MKNSCRKTAAITAGIRSAGISGGCGKAFPYREPVGGAQVHCMAPTASQALDLQVTPQDL